MAAIFIAERTLGISNIAILDQDQSIFVVYL